MSSEPDLDLECTVLWRGQAGYEDARRAAIWNGRKPDRQPEVIVLANTERDVVAAVALARERGMRIGIRSGGHSWVASGVRDGGMLLDLSGMCDIEIDPRRRTASVGPAARSAELVSRAQEHGLFFPAGHCPSVGMGGFLLGGGFGIGSRRLGPACFSVKAIDVVTAEGEMVHADESRNATLLWAARGSGPGFFAIVTRFHLDLHPMFGGVLRSLYAYPLAVCERLIGWLMSEAERFAPELDSAVICTQTPGSDVPVLLLPALALSDSTAESRRMLEPYERCPVLDQALTREVAVPTTIKQFYDETEGINPEGWRYAADNIWTDAGPQRLAPRLQELFGSLPSGRCQAFFSQWRNEHLSEHAAFSVQASAYVAVYAIWENEVDDDAHRQWVTGSMRGLEDLSVGLQLQDADLAARPDRYLSASNNERLEALRATHDPNARLHSYLTTS